MKKLFLLSIAISSYGLAFSQNGNVGIGTTTPNADAKLDITATNKGLLLPRVALTGTANAAPLSAHVAGMTVYNTKDTLDVTKGTYYNNGIKWIKIGDAATAWSLTGNAGTTPGTNYLGTKDSTALVFKTNATNDTSRRMVIMPNGYVGIGTSNPLSMFHIVMDNVPIKTYPELGLAAGGPPRNAANDLLWERIEQTHDGSNIVLLRARGNSAARSNLQFGDALSGFSNIGWINGKYQVLSSMSSLYQGNGTTGLSSTYIVNSGANAISIDTLNNIGIGTTAPQAKLHIEAGNTPATVGTGLKLVDGSQGNGKVLTSDSNGVASWKPLGGAPTNKYTNLTTSRAFATEYTNTTNRTIYVVINGLGVGYLQLKLDGINVFSAYSPSASYDNCVFFAVPPGSTYACYKNSGTAYEENNANILLRNWLETRSATE